MADPVAPASAWQALTERPLRLLGSSWPWRSLAYLTAGLPLALAWLIAVVTAAGIGLVTAPLGVGLLLLAAVALSGGALAVAERRRLRLVDSAPAASPHRAVVGAGPWAWLRFRLREAATWKELGLAPLLCLLGLLDGCLALIPSGLVIGLITAPIQALLLPHVHPNRAWQQILQSPGTLVMVWLLGLWAAAGSAYLFTAWAALRASVTRRLLVRPPVPGPEAELLELAQSRARIVDAYEAERLRMERDLHDGVQQRLTALIMTIGLARLELEEGPTTARKLVSRAHEEAGLALSELRDLVHGIRPAVLADRGLPAAVPALAERTPVPVELDVNLPRRLPEAVESAAYYVVSEALANLAKHSGATAATVALRIADGLLTIEVRDNGRGGAAAGPGGGLVGLADRVAALGGVVRLSSPRGGPTVVYASIPCGS